MDEIIYLEPDEEITSVIDKIKNATTCNIGLVVPRDATLLQSVVNLRLLIKEAGSLGKQIAIVTQDKIGRNLAAQVGIPVFNSIEEQKPIYQPPPPKPSSEEVIEIDNPEPPQEPPKDVQVHHFQEKPIIWRKKEPPKLKMQMPGFKPQKETFKNPKDFVKIRKIIWPIVAILVVLGLVASYLLVPHATVTAYVASSDLKKSLDIIVSAKVKKADLSQGIFPGTLITSEKEAQDQFPATGKKTIGTKASGSITVYNNYDSGSHSFSVGSKLSSFSKTFLLTEDITVPGASVQSGKVVPGSVTTKVEAENPGSDYNIKAGRFTILGLSSVEQEGIYGNSTESMSGGESREVQVISQEDFDKAKEKLSSELTKDLEKDFKAKVDDKKLIEKAIEKPDPEISAPQVDSEAQNFTMKVILKEKAIVFDMAKFKDFLTQILEKQISSDKMVTIVNDDDIGFEVNKMSYSESQELNLKTNILAKVSQKISSDEIINQILGKSNNDALTIVKNQSGIERAEISFFPSWWFKKIPDFKRNVKVQIEYVNK